MMNGLSGMYIYIYIHCICVFCNHFGGGVCLQSGDLAATRSWRASSTIATTFALDCII